MVVSVGKSAGLISRLEVQVLHVQIAHLGTENNSRCRKDPIVNHSAEATSAYHRTTFRRIELAATARPSFDCNVDTLALPVPLILRTK